MSKKKNEGEGGSLASIPGEESSGQKVRRCKGPEAGECLVAGGQ